MVFSILLPNASYLNEAVSGKQSDLKPLKMGAVPLCCPLKMGAVPLCCPKKYGKCP